MTFDLVNLLILSVIGYLIGGFPSAYIWSKIARNIDIQKVGTGNNGASNVYSNVGKSSGLFVFLFDALIKGYLPTFLLLRLEIPNGVLILSLLSLIAGHNWSVFLRFKGGRGVASSIGVILGLGMWWQMIIMVIGPGLIGRGLIYKDSAPWTIVSLILLIFISLFYESQYFDTWFLIGLLVLIISKRILSNVYISYLKRNFLKVLFLRIVFDRDVADKTDWVKGDSL